MDRIEQVRRIGVVMMLGPLALIAMLGNHQNEPMIILAAGCSLVGLGVLLWAQMIQAAQERAERDYRR